MAIEIIRLNLIPDGKVPVVHCKQYDVDRAFKVCVYEGDKPYIFTDETVELNVRKSDTTLVTTDLDITSGVHCLVVHTTEQMCAVVGKNECEIRVIKEGANIGSLNFIMEIKKSPTEGGLRSDSEINNLQRQMEDIIDPMLDEKVPPKVEELVPQVIGEDYYNKTETNNLVSTKMDKTNPTGTGKIAVGQGVVASGAGSQAFGVSSTASGLFSHAEGFATTASGESSHAEGNLTTASGQYSHAEGCQTIASGRFQHVSGKYNVADNNNTYAEIIGNGGSSYARSNARTLDWQGNETLAGDLTFNGNTSLTSEISRLDNRITELPEAMVFKGTLGVNGDIQTLPTPSASNEGWTFKCITAGTYSGLTLKVGDTVTCFNPPNTSVYEWDISGYGDTDTDTWRSIKVNGTEELGSGISSGSVDFVGSENIDVEFDSNGNKIGIKTKNIYTKTEVDGLLDDKADKIDTYTKEQVDDIVYNILPDDTASGAVANFETSLELPLKSLEIDVNAVQASGTPTPQSPKAISGVSAVNVFHSGVNLFDKSTIVNDVYISDSNGVAKANTGDKSTDYILVVPNCSYYIKSEQTEGKWGAWYDKDKNFIEGINLYNRIKTAPQNARYMRLTVIRNGNGNPDTFAVNYPASDTEYHAYNNASSTTLINLGGTYYGGHFTQDKEGHRQFEVTHSVKLFSELDFRRSNSSGSWSSYVFFAQMSDKTNKSAVKCSNYDYVTQSIASMQNETITSGSSNEYIYIRDDNYTTVEAFKTANANTQVWYELATPIIIDLPDGEPIITLVGTNNIFADTGDTSVVFKDSVNGYVERNTASVQALTLNT